MAVITADTAKLPLYKHNPLDTIQEYEMGFQSFYVREGSHFKDKEQAELFYMLPLSASQRESVMKSVREESKLIQELKFCTGDTFNDQSHEHRKFCLNCMNREKYAKIK